jgi:maltose O-acetyltransferase
VANGLGGALARTISAFRLRSVDRLGKGATVDGRPYISNKGSIVVGDAFHLGSRPVKSHLIASLGARIEIGDRVFISYGAAISAQREVVIGDDTRMGPFTVVMDGDFHRADDRSAAGEIGRVRIGKGVDIGARVTILRGTNIGDGARVRSGSMVSGTIPPGASFGGVPARALTGAAPTDELDLPNLVMHVLGLSRHPDPSEGPDQIPEWDSLGTLRLLLAVEERFGIALGEDDMKAARSVAHLSEMVAAARERATDIRPSDPMLG